MLELPGVTSKPKRLDLERRAFLDLIRMTNTLAEPVELARQLVVVARYLSDCEAVAIRLKAGPGYPYAAALGFPERFLALEDDLCARDPDGRLLRDEHRQPCLACLCGQVIRGRVNRARACYTDRGSFIASSASQLLASSLDDPLHGHPWNRCHAAGYGTLGLFPIRRDQVTYGLIQCNDPAPGRLRAGIVDLMENLAASAAHLFQLAMA
jgi:hypothetical protein